MIERANMNKSTRWSVSIPFAALGATLLLTSTASAQSAGAPPGYGAPSYGAPGYGAPGYGAPSRADERAEAKERKRMVRRWEPGDPIPLGYHVVNRPRLGLAIAGGVLLGTFWTGSIIGALSTHASGYLPLIAPVAGPFIAIGTTRSDWGAILLVGDGLIQASGLAMLLAGALTSRERLVRDEARSFILPAPMRVGTGQGFGLVGTF
jgi:hypothetical protein